jgi:hypothetical protein
MNLLALSSQTPARRRLILNLLGLIVLIAGISSAASIWLAQDRIDRQANAGATNATEPLSPEDSRRYTHDVELYYGETGMLMEKWKRWIHEMTQGKPLADTIAVASLILASGLFYVASNRNRPTQPQQ